MDWFMAGDGLPPLAGELIANDPFPHLRLQNHFPASRFHPIRRRTDIFQWLEKSARFFQ